MSVAEIPERGPVPAGGHRATGEGVTLTRVVRSEWTKLWSVRSTRWSLLAAFVAQAGLGPLIAALSMANWNQENGVQRLTFNAIDRALGGFEIAQLAIGVLGVLVISGEYSTGQIRSSLTAVPTRLPLLWAKLIVFASVTFVLMLLATVIGFFGAQAIFTEHAVNVTLSAPGALRAVIGVALYLTATGIMCTALGTILRATAGAIATFVGLLLVLPGVVAILPANLSNSISPYLPANAGGGIARAALTSGNLAPWTGFAVYCGYVVVLVALAAFLLRRRDA